MQKINNFKIRNAQTQILKVFKYAHMFEIILVQKGQCMINFLGLILIQQFYWL